MGARIALTPDFGRMAVAAQDLRAVTASGKARHSQVWETFMFSRDLTRNLDFLEGQLSGNAASKDAARARKQLHGLRGSLSGLSDAVEGALATTMAKPKWRRPLARVDASQVHQRLYTVDRQLRRLQSSLERAPDVRPLDLRYAQKRTTPLTVSADPANYPVLPDPAWTAARGHMGQRVMRAIHNIVVRHLLRIHVSGSHNVPQQGAVLVAPTHGSAFDPLLFAAGQRRTMRFMAAKPMLDAPVTGPVLRAGGAFPVEPGGKGESAVAVARNALHQGDATMIFPEGRTPKVDHTGEPRSAVARLALETGAPVVPAAAYGNKPRHARTGTPFPKLEVAYGEPMRFDQYEPTPLNTAIVRETIWRENLRLLEETRQRHESGGVLSAMTGWMHTGRQRGDAVSH